MADSVNFDSMLTDLGQKADAGVQDVGNLAENMDVTSPADMAKMQMAMMHMNMAFQLQASVTKSIEDMLKAILQRM